ncbi:MAG: TetR/AcrR family transcriptional regulator [Lachnospiraceae bacterium]|nr:TetR/AcrR family transcriptional regulator [Lachnospiraceae bacterium]
MPKRISGVSKRLLEVAREEFLQKGYESASLRTIAAKAATSPRAIYTRFANKEALFHSVVAPVYEAFCHLYEEERAAYWERAKKGDLSVDPVTIYIRYIEFAYEHREDFILLLTCSGGTRYENFTRQIAKREIQGVYEHLPQLSAVDPKEAMRLFIEKITYAFYENLFSPVTDGVDLAIAREYVRMLTSFYNTGIAMGAAKDALDLYPHRG